MNYLFVSDILWYLGHVLSGSSILFTHNEFYVSACLVFFGQFITIISRPIGRIKTTNKISIILDDDEEKQINDTKI